MSETLLWHAENSMLAVTIYADASATFLDKLNSISWRMLNVALQEDGPIDIGHVWLRTDRSFCEEYPARFQGTRTGELLLFTLFGREHRLVGRLSCLPELVGSKFYLHILTVDETLPSLVFPPPIESESLVIPSGVGKWIRTPLHGVHAWVFPSHLNMRWFGGLRGDAGWLAIVEDGYTDAGVLATGLHISPAWLKSLGHWSGKRTLSYQFMSGGYVALALAYRAYAIEHGLHRPLAEKIQQTPALQNLLGAPLFSFMIAQTIRAERFEARLQSAPTDLPLSTNGVHVKLSYAAMQRILSEIVTHQIERAFVVIRGWIQGGYDESHPDVWPPEPALGSVIELQDLLHGDKKYTVALHDNYADIYQQSASWPTGVNRLPNGDPMPGGYWAGGQAYIINSRNSVAYAKRNWEQLKTLQPLSMFIDTTSAVQLCQSYEPGNELTRAQDEQLKIALLHFYKEQGVALGSEEGADFAVPLVDWFENRHRRSAGISIPLWPLVFHDAAFCVRYGPGHLAPESSHSTAPRWLTDMLWGYSLLWGHDDAQQWFDHPPQIQDLQHVQDWHRQIGTAAMVNHRYLTPDGEVEQTFFSNGASIIVNFSTETRTVSGVTIPPHHYLILEA